MQVLTAIGWSFTIPARPVQLGGWSLTDNSDPRQFIFSDSAAVAASGFLQIVCRQGSPPVGLIAPFQLNRHGETIALYDPSSSRIDAVPYGPVVQFQSVGLVDDRWTLCEPTPGTQNRAAELGSLT